MASSLTTDFNVSPYFDDDDEAKNFYRILFRPILPVQARELTQIQTIIQRQISRFGAATFKDGSIVDGVAITYYPNVHYISLEDSFNTSGELLPTDIDSGYLITNGTNSNNAVRAVVKVAKNGNKVDHPNTNRFYFDYIGTGTDVSNNDVNLFVPGDTLYVYSNNQNKFGTLDANNLVDSIETLASNGSFTSNGYGYCIQVSDGIIFQKGFFSAVEPQTITVTEFNTNVSGYVVGFDTLESIITENEDTSLTDGALGYPNENAPGAHRLKLTPSLVAKTRTDVANNKNFFAIVEFDGNEPTQQRDDPVYTAIGREIALGTYEESGDFAVKPFQIETRTSSNSSNFYYEISPGVVYVRGRRIEKIGPTKVEVPKASTTEVSQNLILTGNYGNYVVCDEFLGAFSAETLGTVSLYDTAQNSISEYEGAVSAVSGSSIGTASVRAVAYSSGDKGTASAQYLVYLFNIRMNSGKSFSDVKSIYTSTPTACKADIVLEGGVAVLKDSTKNSVAFNSGIPAVKRLTGNTGIGDTSYIYDQLKSASIVGAGTVTVTIDSAGPGAGEERLTSTTGTTLTGSSLADYHLFAGSSAAYTANLVGNVAINSGNTSIVGSGTTFQTDLKVGQNLRLYVNSTSQPIRSIVSITSNTVLNIDAPITGANAATKIQKYYVDGSPIPLTSVTITSNTSFTANVGAVLDSGTQTVYLQYPVYRNQATAIPKIVKKSQFVKIDCSNNIANSIGPWSLGLPDIYNIRNVYVGTTYSNTNPERSAWFTLDSGQRDDIYDLGRLIVKSAYASQITGSTKILVELDSFVANTSASVGFFSVESYPVDDANTANTNAIQTIQIPQYNGVDLRSVVDFRPFKANTAEYSTSEGSATINPAVSNSSFSVPAGGQYMISPDSNFVADFEYYLPRYDLITIDQNGAFAVNKGVPSVAPKAPFVENDQSVVAESYVSAYPSATKREYDENKNSTPIRVAIKTVKRYTMKDIGAIDERVKRIEYYTVLNSLEQQARDLTIPDVNGLDRFKNGIFADPFNSHNIGNVSDFEYKIAIDPQEAIARPYFTKHDIDFEFNSSNSTNVTKTGPVLTLPYTNETFIAQRFATKIRNATESVWQWNGVLSLYPAYDFFRDEETAPNVNINLDFAAPWEQFENSPFGAIFGDWRDVGSSTTVETSQAFDAIRGGSSSDTTTTTTSTSERLRSNINVDTFTNQINLGSYVTDIAIQPYMRTRLVAFVSNNMKPNTTLHAFFDDINVDVHCAPGVLSGLTNVESGREDRVVNQLGAFGDPLVSDANGFVCGLFRIPASTFRTGDRLFQLLNVDDLVTGSDAILTRGKGTYTADNVAVTRGSTSISIRQPIISTQSVVESRTQSSVTVDSIFTAPPIEAGRDNGDGGGNGQDPIAQSFSIVNAPVNVSAIFATKVGVYFKTKDANLGCSLYVCEMNGGLPDASKIIGSSYLPSASISTSDDASVETQFTLEFPVALLTNNDYAFIVQPDGDSPEYTIWVGETGEFDVLTGEQTFSNPYSGVLFVSSNRKTWTSIQKEDIKFNLYRARFSSSSGTAVFTNETDEFLTVDGFTRANTSLSIEIGDTVYTVNSSATAGNVASLASNTLSTKVMGRIQYINQADGTLWLDSSTANSSSYFSDSTNPTIAIYKTIDPSNTSLLNVSTLVAYANIVSVDNLKYHTVVPKFGVLQPSRTNLSYEFKGTTVANTADAVYQTVTNDYDYQFTDVERHIMSRSNETSSFSSAKTGTFRISMETDSDYVTPMLNLSRKSTLFIENLINSNTANEHTRYGAAATKYISKKIVLADGQEAEDLKVYLTAYRPADTDIKIYAKFKNNQDSEPFDDKVWTLMQYDNGGEFVYSSPTNVKDYIEYEFSVPSVNSVAGAAFANTNVDAYNPRTGTVSIANNSSTITGNGTLFTTEFTVGDEIKIQAGSYFAVRTIVNIANTTSMTVDNGLQATNSAAIHYVFASAGNDGIVEYYNSANSRFIGYKEVALKIVLTSTNPVKVPRLDDVRGICLQI